MWGAGTLRVKKSNTELEGSLTGPWLYKRNKLTLSVLGMRRYLKVKEQSGLTLFCICCIVFATLY